MPGRRAAWLTAPALLALAAVSLYPALGTLWLSVTSAGMVGEAGAFVGADNYTSALTSAEFWAAFRVTVVFTLLTVAAEMAAGLAVALLLDMPLRGITFVRGLLIVPWALPTVINAMAWRVIYNPEFGALNAALMQTGVIGSYRSWLGDPDIALYAIAAADIWKTFPLVALLLLAALQSVPASLHEAARIDGAGVVARFRAVTWPSILTTISVVAVLRVIEAVKVFDIIWVMTKGGPLNATRSLAILVYQQAFSFRQTGMGAALAVLSIGLSVVLIALYIGSLRRLRHA